MLNAKQDQAAYLISIGCDYPDIIQKLEITAELLLRWTQLPHFTTAIDQYRQGNIESQRNKLEFLSGKAITALEDMLTTGSAVEKLRAIQIILDKVDFYQTLVERDAIQESPMELLDNTPSTSNPATKTIEHEPLEEIDETILEECLEDLQTYLEGEMSLEKAKARLYPIISPNHLNFKSASAILTAVKTQVDLNSAKHLYVGKVT